MEKRVIRLVSLFLPLLVLLWCSFTATDSYAVVHLPAMLIPDRHTQATPVGLESLFGSKKKEAPKEAEHYAIYDDKTFEAGTRVFHMQPYHNANLEFEIRLPKNWQSLQLGDTQSVSMAKYIVGDLARFKSELIGTSYVTTVVTTQNLTYEISAKNWLRNYFLSAGYTMQGEITETPDMRTATGAYTFVSDLRNFYTHVTAKVNGSSIILVSFQVPLDMKEYIGYLQKKAVASFKIVYPKTDPIEQRKIFTILNCLKLSYPMSWNTANPDFKDMNRPSVQLQNKNEYGTLQGYMRFQCVRRTKSTSLMQEIDNLKDHFQKYLNIGFKELKSSEPAKVAGKYLFTREEIYTGNYLSNNAEDPEVHIVILGDDKWYVLAYLITQTDKTSLPLWGRNVISFQKIVEKLGA